MQMTHSTFIDYITGPETNRRRELAKGVLREPPSPFYSHQRLLLRLSVLLDAHVRQHDIGVVCLAPMDVILDAAAALVLQPDVMVITHARAGIIRQHIYGAPDLVVEVESAGSLTYDRQQKRRWYREYGVREYWLVDPVAHTIRVIENDANGSRSRTFRGRERLVSVVLPQLDVSAHDCFEATEDRLA